MQNRFNQNPPDWQELYDWFNTHMPPEAAARPPVSMRPAKNVVTFDVFIKNVPWTHWGTDYNSAYDMARRFIEMVICRCAE